MSDFYTEKLVKKQQGTKELIIKAVLVAVAVTSVISIFLLRVIFFIPVIIIALVIFAIYQMDVEYEYLYVNGDLDIDKITHKSRRKRKFSASVDDMEFLAPLGDPGLHSYSQAKVLDYSSGRQDADVYAMIVRQNGELVELMFEPDETILEGMWMMAPRKVVRKK